MPFLARKTYILLKTETTEGTDAVPTGTDALLCRMAEPTPLNGEMVSRDLIRPYFGNYEQQISKTSASISFEVELAGSGTAGTAPKYGSALKASGMSETIVASTSVTYAPVSSTLSSCTIVYNIDGIQQKLVGCRGTYSVNATLGQIPTISFNFTGKYAGPTDTTAVAVTYANQTTPLVVRQGNTSAFSLFGYAGILSAFTLDLANELTYRELVGGTQQTLLTNRAPSGSFMIELPSIASKDFFSLAIGTVTGVSTFLHGTTAGNKVTFTANQTDVLNPTYGEMDGIKMLNVPVVFTPTTAGNDEVSWVFT